MKRRIFSEEHEMFREAFRKFVEREVLPNKDKWEEAGMVDPEIYRKAGEAGFLCPWLPEEYGGVGADFLYSAIMIEEMARVQMSAFALSLHNDIVVPYIYSYGTEEQKRRWLPGCTTGEYITAVAMTEPNAGSDLASIRTTAIRDGDYYVLNGQKTFITNGLISNLLVVAAKTDPKADPPYRGISLFVVEGDTPGFIRGRKLEKIGMKGQDTAELFFEDCRVPASNLLGKEGAGFYYLMEKLQQERLVCAIGAQAAAEAIFDMTLQYCLEREQFGRPIGKFQVNRHKLVDMKTEIEIGRVFVDRLIVEHNAGEEIISETCMAKWWITEMLKRVADQCLQLHGGYGYMLEYPIAKAYLDVRVQTIYAGTTEIMKEIIGKRMGL